MSDLYQNVTILTPETAALIHAKKISHLHSWGASAIGVMEIRGFVSRVQHVERVDQTVVFPEEHRLPRHLPGCRPIICFGVDTDQSFCRTLTQRSAPLPVLK